MVLFMDLGSLLSFSIVDLLFSKAIHITPSVHLSTHLYVRLLAGVAQIEAIGPGDPISDL